LRLQPKRRTQNDKGEKTIGIFDELKSIAKVLREADKIEQYQQILDVQERLLEMQNKIAELESENKDLKEKLKVKENLTYEKKCLLAKQRGQKRRAFLSSLLG